LEEFEDTKVEIRIRKSMKNTQHNDQKMDRQHNDQKMDRQHNDQKMDRQHNDQKKKDKRVNNDLQNIHIKLKIE
jgi:hypothetical protein